MEYDSELARKSQIWANRLLEKILCHRRKDTRVELVHDFNNGQDGTGENIYYTTDSGKDSSNVPFTLAGYCAKADAPWYNEIEDYSYATQRSINGKAIGHFTQMVWKGSTRVGYAVAKAQDPRWTSNTVAVVVAKYTPPGNYRGQYGENVLPLAK